MTPGAGSDLSVNPSPKQEGQPYRSADTGDPRKEFDRERRVVDQMLTMQAHLRDAYRLAETALTCTILVASTISISFAFAAPGGQLTIVGIRADRTTWLGWLAVATFAVTLVDLVLDLRGSARQRRDAVVHLGNLKSAYYAPIDSADELAAFERLSERYRATMGSIPEIPERRFNQLKASHLRKVELSRLLSQNPGISVRQAKRKLRERHDA